MKIKKISIALILLISFSAQAVNEAFFNQVIMTNIEHAITASTQMIKAIKRKDSKDTQVIFTQLVGSWKKVEAIYVLGDLNEDFLDTPRYIDMFYGNNEDIKSQLNLIISSDDDLSYALYKNSHKTINALEYMLFTQNINQQRTQKITIIIANSILKYLREIKTGYLKNQQKFVSDEKFASAILLNTLIDNTYKLKEWRVGDVAGLSKKYQNKANKGKAEYTISKNSMFAINAILAAQKQIIDGGNYRDFSNIAREFGAKTEIQTTIKNLNQAIKDAKMMTDADLSGDQGKVLYASIKQLMKSYYITLMDRMGFISKILDADGD